MPFTVNVSSASRRPVQARATGGYQTVSMPDPNDPNLARAAMVGPNSGDPGGGALQARALADVYAARQAANTAIRPTGAPNLISSVLPDARWQGLRQALFEAGADKLRTSAAAHQGAPGFFDTQQARMPRAMSANEAALLQEMLKQSATKQYSQIGR